MNYAIIVRTKTPDIEETRYVVSAPSYLEALKQCGYYVSEPSVYQVLITEIKPLARVLHLVSDENRIEEKE